jgi:PAS domain S-box-containing protein
MGEVEDNPSTGDGLGGQGARSRSDFLRAVVATTPECIKVVASDGRLLQMNPAGLQMIEAPAWEGVDRASTFDLIAPEHQALWRHHHERVCQGETLTWEFDIIGLAGTRRQMETHAVPIELDDGGVGQLAITRDVSANKRTERALYEAKAALEDRVAERTRDLQDALARLQESERSFSLLVTSVTDYAIYMLDPEGRVVSWNTGAGRIKGYTAEEIIGQHFSRFYTEQDRLAGLPQAGLRTAARDGRLATEGWRVRKDGSRFWASVVIDAIQSDGALVGFAKITRDITEQKAAEAKLRQAQKMEAVGRFTGGAAHDFNNLLMAISASLELLRKRLPLDDERANGMLDNAMQGVRRGASLTQRMLAFARRQDLKPDIVDLAPLLGGMSDVLERALPPMVTLQFDIPSSTRATRCPRAARSRFARGRKARERPTI